MVTLRLVGMADGEEICETLYKTKHHHMKCVSFFSCAKERLAYDCTIVGIPLVGPSKSILVEKSAVQVLDHVPLLLVERRLVSILCTSCHYFSYYMFTRFRQFRQ